MRQNCLPQVVNRWISHRITIVATAAITQALAIHHSDVSSSLPQSNVGVNILSISEKYLDNLLGAPERPQLLVGSGSSRHSPSPTSSR